MNSFDESCFKGYTEHTKDFDKWCEKAYPILGKVTQTSICEFDSSGYGFIIANRPDYGEKFIDQKGYLFDKALKYYAKFSHNITFSGVSNEGEFSLEIPYPMLDINYEISYKQRIDDSTIRIYGFSSDSPSIHNAFANNVELFKKFLKHYIQENSELVKGYADNKINFAEVKEDFFAEEDIPVVSDRDKINKFLSYTGLIKEGERITPREWQCLQLYKRGHTASHSSNILGISSRTIEGHFASIKNKLGTKLKSDLIEITS